MNLAEPIWITGVGTANPLGHSYPETADNLLAGVSGVGTLTEPEMAGHISRIAGRVAPLPAPPGWDAASFARLDEVEQMFFWCAIQALRDADLWDRRSELRIGLVLGLGSEWMVFWETDLARGGRRIYQPQPERRGVAEKLRHDLGLTGPVATVAAACASANYALAQARRWLWRGWVDVCLAGGGDRSAKPMCMACFANLGALSRRNDAPQAASRPFDRDRDGFVMGEGGALFVLEAAAAARRRRARAYAEVAGFGASSDAFHMVMPNTDPQPAVQALRAALDDARLDPADVDYVNAHGTSTPLGDVAETRVLQIVLGEACRRIPVSSTKSMTGHALSGAAAIDALACLTALERQAVPPTINLDQPDPACDLCHVPHQARPHRVRVALSNAFGFGGSNTCLILRQAS
ncbi:MAG: beta-ketoacyl-[acyl-carrier-protein] synthase family protein [Gemmataceae bacterium]|nr:beta-ketoacyl-[acyl-carrier-protein] synthase family protein [Gemmataceae bacterium]MDW8264489.1 beta-ketoacyl-[acyl-carrier-protein] synthase family protein [Gemmataceae bacterium]